ncbi:MAG TPA: NAD-glutamate dehydrogenase, partial [Gammaproteobacteria bacterium]|nr:NAD-glutamate dehydrogenase [Gammaproteobacteria bacterium]
ELLRDAFDADSVDFTVYLSTSVLARLYLIVHTRPGHLPEYDIDELEERILETTRTWGDGLKDELLAELGEEHGNRLFQQYRHAFPGSYRDDYAPSIAVLDVTKMEALQTDSDLGMTLYRPLEAPAHTLRFKLFRKNESISLSLVLPMLENMGVRVVDQRPHRIRPEGNGDLWVQDIGMAYHRPGQLETEQISQIFQEAFERIWRGEMENDGFNQLVLEAHLGWRDVVILRTYCKYLLQTGFPFSQAYMERAMANQPQIASLLVSLFHAYFTPEDRDAWQERAQILEESIQHSLDAVPNLDEDRILRRFYTVLKATLRTNFFQEGGDGRPKDYLSIKLDPTSIPDLDPPRPAYEIFVYSPRTAGVHLRGGKVARGGIRWSDRLEDFRTEVFGLMKAQTVKNAVIVPVGAKGGFVVKRPPAGDDRQALVDEAVHCYSTFIRGLLDLTDNRDGSAIVPPPRVVRYDDDDPYLVVAADKGTATFSDTANAIAAEYGYWLGDAFASGGSSGYDHKAMGITARGAWESVRRHFRELGRDIQNEDFTVVGIGGMAGDVFGNGMLLSRHIRLIGAFSHREIFLDPNPDPEASFRERERLFHLPRASWKDYDADLISEGGGVFSRGAKSIPVAPALQEALGVAADQLTPDEVIQALLRAPADLLWNGGIGTFVKSSDESHDDADDRANDNIRVDAAALRCKVIGEGGNLGMTQNGRIEFARRGGRVNTDFIDNSGGVDCSDHEVNIKILLDQVVRDGDLSGKQRNELLQQMTEEVADLVLRNNYLQTEALSMSETMAVELLDEHINLMHALEKSGRLERSTWDLPDDEAIAERRAEGVGLTRPELSVLLSYTKIDLYDALLDSDVCEDPYLAHELEAYFPAPIQERFPERMADHRLRREIIATFIANSMVNRMGVTFVAQMRDQTGATPSDIARAYTATRRVFGLRALWQEVSDLDNRVATEHQLAMLRETRKLVRRASLWFLRNRKQPLDIAAAIEAFEEGIAGLRDALPDLLDEQSHAWLTERAAWHIEHGVPEDCAMRFAGLTLWVASLDIVQVASLLDQPAERVTRFYFTVGHRLQLDWLRDRIADLPREEHWAHLARAALRDDLARQQCAITFSALKEAPTALEPEQGIAQWEENNRTTVDRFLQRMAEFSAGANPDLALLSVALNEVHKLVPNAQVASSEE